MKRKRCSTCGNRVERRRMKRHAERCEQKLAYKCLKAGCEDVRPIVTRDNIYRHNNHFHPGQAPEFKKASYPLLPPIYGGVATGSRRLVSMKFEDNQSTFKQSSDSSSDEDEPLSKYCKAPAPAKRRTTRATRNRTAGTKKSPSNIAAHSSEGRANSTDDSFLQAEPRSTKGTRSQTADSIPSRRTAQKAKPRTTMVTRTRTAGTKKTQPKIAAQSPEGRANSTDDNFVQAEPRSTKGTRSQTADSTPSRRTAQKAKRFHAVVATPSCISAPSPEGPATSTEPCSMQAEPSSTMATRTGSAGATPSDLVALSPEGHAESTQSRVTPTKAARKAHVNDSESTDTPEGTESSAQVTPVHQLTSDSGQDSPTMPSTEFRHFLYSLNTVGSPLSYDELVALNLLLPEDELRFRQEREAREKETKAKEHAQSKANVVRSGFGLFTGRKNPQRARRPPQQIQTIQEFKRVLSQYCHSLFDSDGKAIANKLVELKDLGDKGLGCLAAVDLHRYQPCITYGGDYDDVCKLDEYDQNEALKGRPSRHTLEFVCKDNRQRKIVVAVNGKAKSSFIGQFANHGANGVNINWAIVEGPNDRWLVEGAAPRLVIGFATRTIRKGEELVWSYGVYNKAGYLNAYAWFRGGELLNNVNQRERKAALKRQRRKKPVCSITNKRETQKINVEVLDICRASQKEREQPSEEPPQNALASLVADYGDGLDSDASGADGNASD